MILHYLSEQIQSPKLGAVVAVGTPSAAAASSFFGTPSPGFLFISAVVGLVLSIVLVIVHIRKEMRESKQWKVTAQINAVALENEQLENKILKVKCNVMEEIDRNISND